MTAVLADESFTACLDRSLWRSGPSCSAPARRSWLDINSVSRLVHLSCDPLSSRQDDRDDERAAEPGYGHPSWRGDAVADRGHA